MRGLILIIVLSAQSFIMTYNKLTESLLESEEQQEWLKKYFCDQAFTYELRREKIGFLPRRKQRRRSASQ